MARYKNIPSGDGGRFQSQMVVDTNGVVKAIYIQNPTAVDIFVSDNPTDLNKTDAAGNPRVGMLAPAAVPPNVPLFSLRTFKGRLFARAVAPGAELEVIESDVC